MFYHLLNLFFQICIFHPFLVQRSPAPGDCWATLKIRSSSAERIQGDVEISCDGLLMARLSLAVNGHSISISRNEYKMAIYIYTYLFSGYIFMKYFDGYIHGHIMYMYIYPIVESEIMYVYIYT